MDLDSRHNERFVEEIIELIKGTDMRLGDLVKSNLLKYLNPSTVPMSPHSVDLE